jgi:hypothetical protein
MKQLLETLDLALEALELNNLEWKALADSGDCGYWNAEDQDHYKQTNQAITAIKQARSAPVQDSACNNSLREQGKAYPRTCRKCGLGPCIGAPKQPPAAQPTTEESSAVKPAAPVQEPDHGNELTIAYMSGLHDGKKKRAWVGLTEQERNDIEDYCEMMIGKPAFEAIEAKLKEKNNG